MSGFAVAESELGRANLQREGEAPAEPRATGGDFSEIALVGDVAPRLAFRMRKDRLTRGVPRSERCLAGGVSVAERRELRTTGTSETCPTMIAIVFTVLGRGSTPIPGVDKALTRHDLQQEFHLGMHIVRLENLFDVIVDCVHTAIQLVGDLLVEVSLGQ